MLESGDRCAIWPVGIDISKWCPDKRVDKTTDFLIYDKIRWNRETLIPTLLEPIKSALARQSLTFTEIRYGTYDPADFRRALHQSRAMIFLAGHESQGIAAQECLSAGVPLFTWEPGFVEDPERFKWGQPVIPATSVPYFDARCGLKFCDAAEFTEQLPVFLSRLSEGRFASRDYILENLTLEKCAQRFLDLVNSAQTPPHSP